MSTLTHSDQLRRELIGRRLPRYYVHRVMREFDDHSQDIAAERAAAPTDVARLGDPRHLANRFATEFRARHFAGRHPWLVFALGPIPCTIVAAMLVYTVGFFLLEACGSLQPLGATSWISQFLAIVVSYAGLIVPLVGVMFCFGRWAYRSGCGARWFWTVCVLQSLLGALAHSQLKLPTEPGNGSFSVGLSVPPSLNWPLLALPILAAIGMAWHVTQRADTARPTTVG